VPLSLTRTVTFRATHHLARADWSAAENRSRFGAVAEPHEHRYACAVTVAGRPDPSTGMLLDLGALDTLLREEVTGPLEGADLNAAVPAFAEQGQLATCEALAAWLYGRIAPRLPPGLTLARVRVAEDATLHADCTGPA
jgi:6-pyruvoyltetrahydropterin/6-carboxytetrahydropterin synthase